MQLRTQKDRNVKGTRGKERSNKRKEGGWMDGEKKQWNT